MKQEDTLKVSELPVMAHRKASHKNEEHADSAPSDVQKPWLSSRTMLCAVYRVIKTTKVLFNREEGRMGHTEGEA